MDVEHGMHDPEKVGSNPTTEPEHLEERDSSNDGNKETAGEKLDPIRTISRVPGNSNYYEKGGLRTEGDGADHTRYNPGSIGFQMTVLGCGFALAGSQICQLLYLPLVSFIAIELNTPGLTIWLFTAIVVAIGVLAPFVGPLADLFGRKTFLLIGLACSILGSILSGATRSAGGFIVGQVFLGFGAAIQELLAIAIASEIVPTVKRPMYAALILCTIIPWSPGTLYANWITDSSWRWIGCALGIWNLINFILIAWFYRPPPRVNSIGLSRKDLLKRVDFMGGILITTGLVCLLVGVNSGGQNKPWKSAYVISFLVIGLSSMLAFGLWEAFGSKWSLFPRRIIHAPRPFWCLLWVIFAAGINYIPLVIFWPIESVSVFDADRHQNGINTLPIGICILAGGIISGLLIGIFPKRVTIIMTGFCILQTVGSACFVAVDPHEISTAFGPLVFALLGVGGVLVPNQVIITIITPDDLIGSVTALTVGLRASAQVIGVAMFYNRFKTEVTKRAPLTIGLAMVKSGIFNITEITDFVTSLTGVPFHELSQSVPELLIPANYDMVKEAGIVCFSESFKMIWWITVAFGVTACIGAAFMGDVSQFMDGHVAVIL